MEELMETSVGWIVPESDKITKAVAEEMETINVFVPASIGRYVLLMDRLTAINAEWIVTMQRLEDGEVAMTVTMEMAAAYVQENSDQCAELTE